MKKSLSKTSKSQEKGKPWGGEADFRSKMKT